MKTNAFFDMMSFYANAINANNRSCDEITCHNGETFSVERGDYEFIVIEPKSKANFPKWILSVKFKGSEIARTKGLKSLSQTVLSEIESLRTIALTWLNEGCRPLDNVEKLSTNCFPMFETWYHFDKTSMKYTAK